MIWVDKKEIDIKKDKIFYKVKFPKDCKITDANIVGDKIEVKYSDNNKKDETRVVFFAKKEKNEGNNNVGCWLLADIWSGKIIEIDNFKWSCVLRKDGNCISIGHMYEVIDRGEK